ncbi:MAG: hypothetical protein AB7Q15_18405, partial [Vicinamibacterales bacterium]
MSARRLTVRDPSGQRSVPTAARGCRPARAAPDAGVSGAADPRVSDSRHWTQTVEAGPDAPVAGASSRGDTTVRTRQAVRHTRSVERAQAHGARPER